MGLDLKSLGKSLAGLAPVLGAALPIPGGAAIGALIARTVGVDEESEDATERVAAALGLNQEEPPTEAQLANRAKMFELQTQHEQSMARIRAEYQQAELHHGREIAGIHAGDRASARGMFSSSSDNTPKHITWFICILWIGMAIAMFAINIPDENRELIIRMQGTLEGAIATTIAFWLGSSAGSSKKNDIIAAELREDDDR